MADNINETIKKSLLDTATDMRISCADARKIAEDAEVDYSIVGAACDELKIKINSCALGCF